MVRRAVLVILFRRPELTRTLLATVIAARPDRVYVSIDGARSSVAGEKRLVDEVLAAVRLAEWHCPVEINVSQLNLGAGYHVKGAISWLFSHEDAGIILEDDCIPSPDFFDYCWQNIANKTDPMTMSIGGYSPVPARLLGNAPMRRSRYALTWGWATWASCWQQYEFDLGDWRARLSPSRLDEIGAGDPWFRTFWTKKFDALEVGTRNIWDYQWVFAVWSQGGHGLLPRVNLIQNRGFGSASTHSFVERKIYAMPFSSLDVNWWSNDAELVDPLSASADGFLHRKFYQAGYAYPITAAARAVARTAINRLYR